MALANSNAYLKYAGGTFPLWVMGLEQVHELAGTTAQSKTYQHFYPRSYFPGAMVITGRVRNQAMYDDLADYIRGHQLALINNPTLDSGLSGSLTNRPGNETIPLLEFNFPEENLLLTGWITPFEAGAKRFNVAPEYTMNFVIASDRHSTNDRINPSFAVRGWWTGAFLDFDENGPIVDATKSPKVSTPRDASQYKWPDTPPDPAQLSAEPIIVQVISGAGAGGGGGGGGGGKFNADGTGVYDPTDFQYGATLPPGHSLDQIHAAAVSAAPAGSWPEHIMNQGMVQGGKISIKYAPLNATSPGNTIWISF